MPRCEVCGFKSNGPYCPECAHRLGTRSPDLDQRQTWNTGEVRVEGHGQVGIGPTTFVNVGDRSAAPESQRVKTSRGLHTAPLSVAAVLGLGAAVAEITGVSLADVPTLWEYAASVDAREPDFWLYAHLTLVLASVAAIALGLLALSVSVSGYLYLPFGRSMILEVRRGRLRRTQVQGECPECGDRTGLLRITTGKEPETRKDADGKPYTHYKDVREVMLACGRRGARHFFPFDIVRLS